ncbi:tRNA lysidine(34) synthetase TilS [Xenorhabdus bovienii]|uniref:tRNA lysidine(34) synthetase TilS n=1 Tax=Xenorhabdus bovienii TaxID=40576 RepID=UPI00237D0D51|nr:tRNA lysidine(34) synthetase TilS [Xenorhabdus bovienii]MDE1486799.1 tRNA lysidine(34) synthetase TilS [Xenorhabdus bovienii]MDE9477600.1 tRNA lysidine(34) synthetase TilS [Xenorhabdus bovienii]MDE9530477.1 tRNA lysidine(34) synthetase TilS [Xenorhabdus bovienii]
MINTHEPLLTMLIDQLGRHKKILIGFSGGLDSTVLLHLLVQLRYQSHKVIRDQIALRAIHIHHGLNPKADKWVEHCRQICTDWKVDFRVEKVSLDIRQNGIEAAARDARYQAFQHELQQGEILVTAQHLDDQAETFLLALKRGSGPAGLSSMPFSMPFAGTTLIRPLLNASRAELETYAHTQRLQWIEDDSNQDDRYDRNFLRLHIMPLLNQRWPHFPQSASRSASLCGEQEQLLDELLNESLNELITPEGAIAIAPLVDCSEAKRNALLRRWFSQYGVKMPAREQLQRIWSEVALSRQDAEPRFRLGQHDVRRYRQQLWLVPQCQSLAGTLLEWDIAQELRLPDGLGMLVLSEESGIDVRMPGRNERVTIRFGVQGNISIVGRQHSRHSKKLWQELGIAPWLRERTPLLYYDETLIAALGVFVTRKGQPLAGEKILSVKWSRTLYSA